MREDGVVAKLVLAIGGGTRNLPWMQMVSDVTGIEQTIPAQQIGASYGDAMLAAVGVGHFSSTAEAVHAWVQIGRVVRPDAATHARYAPYYELYRQLYTQTASTMHALSQLARGPYAN
jgi:xylulokinase